VKREANLEKRDRIFMASTGIGSNQQTKPLNTGYKRAFRDCRIDTIFVHLYAYNVPLIMESVRCFNSKIMTDDIFQQTTEMVRQPFELDQAPPPANEEELLALLADRIGELLASQPDYLMSLLYRLDVLERKIRPVMQPDAPEPANWGLARLVLERQKQRAVTKRTIKPKPLEDMEGWEW
jgi:hypothetical protein